MNHLESFNGLLKRKYIPRWQRSGTRLQFDFLIHVLIAEILPDIFASRLSNQHYREWLANRFADHAGGVNLVELKKVGGVRAILPSCEGAAKCWWQADPQRDDEAQAIFQLQHVHSIRQTVCPDQYEAACFSMSAPLDDGMKIQYELRLHRAGHGYCSCPDFVYRGGACKHLQAFRLVIESWVHQHIISPFVFPATLSAAELLHPSSSTPETLPEPSETITSTTIYPGSASSSKLNNFLTLQRLAKGDVEASDVESDEDADNLSESASRDEDTEDISSDVRSVSDLASQEYTVGSSVMLVCSLILYYMFMFLFRNNSLLRTPRHTGMQY